MANFLCVMCGDHAAVDVEVAFGLWAGLCTEHLAQRQAAITRREVEEQHRMLSPAG